MNMELKFFQNHNSVIISRFRIIIPADFFIRRGIIIEYSVSEILDGIGTYIAAIL